MGTSPTSRRIADAVDDEEWQKFRVSMKGKSTTKKLEMLHEYYIDGHERAQAIQNEQDRLKETYDVRIRVDNYLKALARGGQLFPGVDLEEAVFVDWNVRIRRN